MKDYDWIGNYYGGFARVRLNHKKRFIDYDKILNTKFNLDSHKLRDVKYGFIDEAGNEVVPCLYNYVDADANLEKYNLKQLRLSKLNIIL